MNRFIKKNMFLVGFLGLAAFGVLALLVLSVFRHAEMRKFIQKTTEMRNTVNKLVREKPPAVEENIKLVQQDIDGYSRQVQDLRLYFGQPFRPALEAFCEKLKVPVDKLLAQFKVFWEREKQMQGPRELTYRRFRTTQGREGDGPALWTPESWDEAMEIFVEKAQAATMEKINERNQEELFLSALGLSRNLGNAPQRLNVFMRTLQGQMVDLLNAKKVQLVGVYFNSVGISSLKSDADFDDLGARKPGDGESRRTGQTAPRVESGSGRIEGGSGEGPSQVIRNWEIMSDLVKRIAESGIESLERLSYDSHEGRPDGDFTRYRYEFMVHGTPAAIRKLLNDLNAAFDENRIYIVKNLSTRKLEDQAQDIIDMAQGVLIEPAAETEGALNMGGGAMGGMGVPRSRTSSSNQASAASYFKEKNVYGEIVIGRSELCEATIVVDYVIYSASDLK